MKSVRIRLLVFVAVWLMSWSLVQAGAWERDERLTGIMPEPQEVYRGSGSFDFTEAVELVICYGDEADKIGAELLQEDLGELIDAKVTIVSGGSEGDIVLTRDAEGLGAFPEFSRIDQAESYRLLVQPEQIVIEGTDARGVLYGVQTLRQLIKPDGGVDGVLVKDWPEMAWRVSYAGIVKPEDLLEHVRRCARLKINAVILESYWNGNQNYWYVPGMPRTKHALDFFNECKKYHIEPIPLIQGLGWGYGVTDRDVMASEGEWHEDVAVTVYTEKATDFLHPNVIRTEIAPIIVTSADGKTVYQEDVDYTIIPGVTVRPFKVDNKRWQIQAIEGGAIADGEEVLLSYNSVVANYHMAYCPSEPRTYKIVDQAIEYLMTRFKPKVVHIGHDEVWQYNSCSRCLAREMSTADLMLEDVLYWYEKLRSYDPDVTILMWYDMISLTKKDSKLMSVIDKLPRDIIICPWIYHTGADQLARMKKEVAFELEQGFPVIGTPSGYWMSNNLDWYDALSEHADNPDMLGMMFTYWGDGVVLPTCLPASAELMWSGSKVNRPLFKAYEKATNVLKAAGMGLTFSLPDQVGKVVEWYNSRILAGEQPHAILEKIRSQLLQDMDVFEQAYGDANWEALGDAHFIEQQGGQIQKFVRLTELMTDYVVWEYQASLGEEDTADWETLINGVKQLGILSEDKAAALLEASESRWLSSEEIFGTALNRYRQQEGKAGLLLEVPTAIQKRQSHEGYDEITFTRPVKLARLESAGLPDCKVSRSVSGHVYTTIDTLASIARCDNRGIRKLKGSPSLPDDLILLEQRDTAEYACRYTHESPKIDGVLDDAIWHKATAVTDFMDDDGKISWPRTWGWLAYDEDALYVAFRAEQAADVPVVCQKTEKGSPVWQDPGVQVFLDTNLDRETYYQIMTNADGVLAERNTVGIADWESGTVVATGREDGGWTVEMAIPLDRIIDQEGGALAGQSWGLNLCRSTDPAATWAPLKTGQAYFFLQPQAFGTMQFLAKQEPLMIHKLLIVGNSLTCHGPSTEALGWDGHWGMAATAADKDYVHQLTAMIAAGQGGNEAELKVGSLLATTWNRDRWDEWADFGADVVVIQTGDNLPGDRANEATFEKPYLELIARLRQDNPDVMVVCTSLWGEGGARAAMVKRVCEQSGARFANLAPAAADWNNRGYADNVYTHEGVRWHPGDKGMRAIAEAIWRAICEE